MVILVLQIFSFNAVFGWGGGGGVFKRYGTIFMFKSKYIYFRLKKDDIML